MHKQIQTTIIIHASSEIVWEILADFEKYPEWNPVIISIRGRLQKGNKLVAQLQDGPKIRVLRPVIQEVIPLHTFSWISTLFMKGICDSYHYFTLEEIKSNQTRLIQGKNFSGILRKPIPRKTAETTRLHFIEMNAALKRRAER